MSYGNTSATYWFRLTIQNQTQQSLYLLLKIQDARLADVYSISANGKLQTWSAGVLRPFGRYSFQTNLPAMDLGTTPQQVYVRLKTPVMYAPMEIGVVKPIVNETHRVDLLFGIITGLLLAMAVYNLAFFFFVKDRLYLYYAGYIFFSAYLIVDTKGLTHEFLFHDNPLWFSETNVSASLMITFAWLFSIRFLNSRALSPVFHRWITFLALLGIALLPTEFFPDQPWVNNVYQVIHLTFSVSLLFGGIHIYLLGYKPAKYYVIAFGCFLTGYAIVTLAFAGILPANKFYTLYGILLLTTQDILRLEALGSYCTIYLSDNKKVVASRPIAYFEQQLDPVDFFRVHKSHLINLQKVERYVRGEGGSVILMDGSEIGVSRNTKQDLLGRLAIS
ncbi:hypothetical protein GCM10028807_08520 [Spirosoma daeguense]